MISRKNILYVYTCVYIYFIPFHSWNSNPVTPQKKSIESPQNLIVPVPFYTSAFESKKVHGRFTQLCNPTAVRIPRSTILRFQSRLDSECTTSETQSQCVPKPDILQSSSTQHISGFQHGFNTQNDWVAPRGTPVLPRSRPFSTRLKAMARWHRLTGLRYQQWIMIHSCS